MNQTHENTDQNYDVVDLGSTTSQTLGGPLKGESSGGGTMPGIADE